MPQQLTERQNEIVDAALRLIAENGMGNLTIRRLSRALNVTDAALYYHFRDKLEIVQALVGRFEAAADDLEDRRGWAAVEDAIIRRTDLVLKTPDLARVVFAEELFQGDPEVEQILFGMMRRHRQALLARFAEAMDAGEIRRDIPPDTLFRMVIGPLRLLIKQWGMSHGAFDLRVERQKLLDGLRAALKS
ncbi:MAG: TetR/AcrR family transcriptional regulator [Lentisphaeria bacterium]|nr:TetR/AcrR family transcriptional regulator [Lentisphaeria bacterium]